MPAGPEQQIAAVLDLENRVLVRKNAALLLFQVQREAQTGGINPTFTELAQTPCGLIPRQGVCDLRQIRGVGNCRKTVVLFGETDVSGARLTSDVFRA